MKNVLLVSIAFPPKNNPECLQTAKCFKYLSKHAEINLDVVTSKSPTLFMPYDSNLEGYATNIRQLIELPIKENKYVNFSIRKLCPWLLQKPDTKFTFFKQWKKVVKSLKQKPDIIYSRSFPLSSALMALQLKKVYNVPWIMHLSDPWVENPIDTRHKKSIRFNESKERECFNIADAISFTSKKTIEIYEQKYPDLKENFFHFPNVFDPEEIVENDFQFKSKIRFVYTGGLVEDRSPNHIFEAIKLLKERNINVDEKAEFVFAGDFDRKNLGYFDTYNLSCVKNLGFVSYAEAQKLQQSADVLLVIDTPFEDSRKAVFFPSKILDYIIAQRRILALTDRASTTYDIVHHKFGECVEHKNVAEIAKQIEQAINAYSNKDKTYFNIKRIDSTFSAEFNTHRLVELMSKL
ncbi:hypothetical protein QQ008_30040 [Fulvivirgaceae bacterium BMA10]|uniref:Glycosyltransferase subfamily 4-like N-terminal domain-containing protein n=1 Tax=Splendidivirga corallicola TaxID=3051826 RepID=A0ABT8KZ82_9BACT|nr:hypothetical protein [Fulvivirgaceae bacterium BMA10]